MRNVSSSFTVGPDRPDNPPARYPREVRWLLPVVFAILACAGGPESDVAGAYVAAMQPVLTENGALAQRFLTEASRVKKKETDGATLEAMLHAELAPQAAALLTKAKAVNPGDPKLDDAHALLVKAWTARSAAYAALEDAWTRGDVLAWDAAMKQNAQAKVDEEAYFTQIDAALAPYELRLEQYP